MELINELPNEIQFNVIKFMRHPVADLFKKELLEFIEDSKVPEYEYEDEEGYISSVVCCWKEVIRGSRYAVRRGLNREDFIVRKCKWCMETFSSSWEVCSDCNECEAKSCEADYLQSLNRSNKNFIDPFSH